MSSTMWALSIYSRLCMKMLSFLFVRTWAMLRVYYVYHVEFHFRCNISCGVAVKVRSHQEKFQVIFSWGGEGAK